MYSEEDYAELVEERERETTVTPDTCKRGHPWDEKNTRYTKAGTRTCRRCDRERQVANKHRTDNDPMTAKQRTLRARMAAYAMHARHDAKETSAKARATFMATFEDQVDPDRTLPEDERQRRAEAARKAHFTRLALRSSQARSARS